MATQIGIIADDFTGANDSGVRLAQKGLRARVILAGREDENTDPNIDVWIVDTDSRAMEPIEAYNIVSSEIERLKKRGVSSFYKKVDSTLRGSVAAELKALQDCAGAEIIFIAPAFPTLGRTVRDGILYVNDIPVGETEFGNDPKTPVLHSYIPDLLASEDVFTAVLTHEILSGKNPEQWVQQQIDSGVKWIICDTVVEEDFIQLVSLEDKLDVKIGWAGSAGLINYLYSVSAESQEFELPARSTGKVLLVSGSLSGKTKEQLDNLAQRPQTLMIEINPARLLEDPEREGETIKALNHSADWDSAVIYVEPSQTNRDQVAEWGLLKEWTANQTGKGISQGLGKLVNLALKNGGFDALIMTGGDTAKDICKEIGVADMELRFEIEAGLPLGMVKWNGKELIAVTKAGGFGNPASLVNAVEFLKGAGLNEHT
ncbi:four-carbon acid sugar kinase family protein [Planococcus soli]|uniref:four-carbon acid sugar kinase family protein n=1 Tax=Planococcus soli TaxID=2666072 RepID=UPI00115D8461|nr:four-carbon acid sugar kinase family protein [Planococcus soli]